MRSLVQNMFGHCSSRPGSARYMIKKKDIEFHFTHFSFKIKPKAPTFLYVYAKTAYSKKKLL